MASGGQAGAARRRSRPRLAAPQRRASGAGLRELAAAATKESILKAALKVFAERGYEGARVGQISRAARSHDRMIYYYFGSKEALFVAVLEENYRRFDEAESALALDLAQPEAALSAVVRFIWGYYQKHPEFITLLNTENLHRGRHLAHARRQGGYASPALAILQQVLDSGAAQGRFRRGLAARDIYLTIAALGYFYLSNRHTLSSFLGEKLESAPALAHWERHIIEVLQRTVGAPRAD